MVHPRWMRHQKIEKLLVHVKMTGEGQTERDILAPYHVNQGQRAPVVVALKHIHENHNPNGK